jgi:DNA-binding NarL/FixJ family response regulator
MTTPHQIRAAGAHEPDRDSIFSRVDSAAKEALRRCATTSDAFSSTEIDAAAVWRDLMTGAYGIVDNFFDGDSCYLILKPRRSTVAFTASARRLDILQSVLAGAPQNNVAIDLELAPSTVALHYKQGLVSLGASDRPSRAHPLLMMAAIAGTEPSNARVRSSRFTVHEQPLFTVATRRPDLHLAKTLPSAELAVIGRLVEGFSYADIAAERRTSTRTIANQITAVFRRLRVSGRNELVRRLLIDEGLIWLDNLRSA